MGGKPCLNVTIVFIIYRVIPSYIIDPCYPKRILLRFGFRHDDISHSVIQIVNIIVIFIITPAALTLKAD